MAIAYYNMIGALQFLSVRGSLTPTGEQLVDITRPGKDGHEFQSIGKRGPVGQLFTMIDVTTAGGVTTVVDSCVALKGTLVTVYDGHGNSCSNVAVLNVEQIQAAQYVVNPVGGVNAGNWLVTMRWTMQPTA